ncbi:MAG: hypothetical protein JXA20_06850 [Spirochaetes bacterium]|nr:hypothetical protein [Spirochaetota bacterium]
MRKVGFAVFSLLSVVAIASVSGCGSIQVDRNSMRSVKKVAVVSVFAPARITVNNPGQAPVFHLVDAAKEHHKYGDEAMRAFAPLGQVLLAKGQEELVQKLARELGWQVQTLDASSRGASYGALVKWSDEHSNDRFQGMLVMTGGACLWMDGPGDPLGALVGEYCRKNGLDAAMICSFDFCYSKSWWGSAGISAKPRTFTGIQVIDKDGKLIVATERADERDRDYTGLSDTTMPISGWTVDINREMLWKYDSATRNSVSVVVDMLD